MMISHILVLSISLVLVVVVVFFGLFGFNYQNVYWKKKLVFPNKDYSCITRRKKHE